MVHLLSETDEDKDCNVVEDADDAQHPEGNAEVFHVLYMNLLL